MRAVPLSSVRGEVTLATVALVAGLTVLAGWLFKPKVFDGDSRRAVQSVEATAAVESATAAALAAAEREKAAAQAERAALEKQAASAAAGVVKVGEANAQAPESPARDFIGREVPAILSKLPAADLAQLLEAEQRRAAVMSGDLKRADALYQREAAEALRLREAIRAAEAQAQTAARETMEAKAALATEQAERRRVDGELEKVAAVRLALERRSRLQWAALAALAVLAGGVWLSGVSPLRIGRALADIRAGTAPATAFDGVLPEWMQPVVKWSRVRAEKKARVEAALEHLPAPLREPAVRVDSPT